MNGPGLQGSLLLLVTHWSRFPSRELQYPLLWLVFKARPLHASCHSNWEEVTMHEGHVAQVSTTLIKTEGGRQKKTQRTGIRGGKKRENDFFCFFCGRRKDYGFKLRNFINHRFKNYTGEARTASCLFPLFPFSPCSFVTNVLIRKEKPAKCQQASTSLVNREGWRAGHTSILK